MKSRIADVANARQVESEAEKAVCKIIEFDILDIFWFEVLRRHPELQLDAHGCKLPLPRNANVNNCLSRTTNNSKDSTVTDLCGDYDVVCSIDNVGSFDIMGTKDLQDYSRINVFQYDVARDLVMEECVGPFILSPLCGARILCDQVLASSDLGMTPTELHRFRHSRFVVAYLVLPELAVDEGAAVDPKKKKPAPTAGGKGAPQSDPVKSIYYRILIIDVIGIMLAGPAQFHAEVVHELLIDCESKIVVPTENSNLKFDLGSSVDSSKEMFDGLHVDLSLDGGLLSVVSSSFRGGCKIYALALRDVNADDVNASQAENEAQLLVSPPHRLDRASLVAVLPRGCSGADAPIQYATILPPSTDNSAGKATRFGSTFEQSCCRVLVTLRGSPHCLLYGFRTKSSEEVAALQQQAATAASAAAGKAAKGAAPPPAPAFDIPVLDVCLLSQWSLSEGLTALALDPHSRSLLALGAKDGTVELWNTDSVSLVDVLGRHKGSPITCLSVRRTAWRPNSSVFEAGVTVVSGALDGTVCVFAAHGRGGQDSNPSPTSHGINFATKAEFGEHHVRLTDYRFDAVDAAVLDIQRVHPRPGELLPDPSAELAVVHYSSGLLAVYVIRPDGTTELVGRLEKRERLNYQFVYSSVHSWKSLPAFEDPVKKVAYLKAAEEAAAVAAQEAEAARLLAIQQAAAEAEKAEKAAAKAGKGKAPHVEVAKDIVDEPEVVETPPEEKPYQYVPQPEEVREDQIDVIPLAQVVGATANVDAGSSRRWQAYRSIARLSGNGVVCSSERSGQPNLMLYSMSSLLTSSTSTSSGDAPGQLHKASSESKSSGALPARPAAKSADPRPTQHLKLTEERLLSLENSFLPPMTRIHSQQQQRSGGSRPSPAADPAALMRASIARSRQEKQARKGVFLSNTATLATLFQTPVVQR